MITIIKDRELIYETEKYDVILVGTSTYCMLSGGFQSKMRFKYPFIQTENDKTPYGDSRKLGKRLTFNNITPIISLLYISNYPRGKKEVIDYNALEKCLSTANAEFSGMKVATTMLGMTRFDGFGDKEKCLQIIEKCTPNLDLTLYDYEQKSIKEEKDILFKTASKESKNRKEYLEKRQYIYDIVLKKLYLK